MSNPTLEEIQEAAEEHQGWCINCEEWTLDCCEPDARKYECPECEHNTVYGAEELIVMGLVELSED